MSFKEKYIEMKNKGMLDSEIAKELGVCRDTVSRWKAKWGVNKIKKVRRNKCNVPEKVLQAGEENGISRRLLLRRIREYGYTEYQAVHTPKNNRRGDVRNKYEKGLDKSDRKRWYYENKRKGD